MSKNRLTREQADLVAEFKAVAEMDADMPRLRELYEKIERIKVVMSAEEREELDEIGTVVNILEEAAERRRSNKQ